MVEYKWKLIGIDVRMNETVRWYEDDASGHKKKVVDTYRTSQYYSTLHKVEVYITDADGELIESTL